MHNKRNACGKCKEKLKKTVNDKCLGEFDGGGSRDDGVAEEFGNEREQAILLRELAVAERSNGAA